MIPILFESNATTYTTNGLGRLADCTRCIATEERNGLYEIEFDYPVSAPLFEDLELGRIVICTHDDHGDEQPFIIYAREVPDLNGIVTFHAHHISYLLNDIVVMPFTASSCASALSKIKSESVNTNPFTFWTDKSVSATYKSTVPRLARNMLGGEENSILDVFGTGEYQFDKFQVKLYTHRGTDSGVEIYYGKNLADLSQELDSSGCYNAIVPFWADSEGNVVTLSEKIISYAGQGERIDAAPMDLSDDFEEIPTQAQLRARARSRYESGDYALPTENIEVNFVQLWQTEEYKQYSALQRVGLCDTVSVFYADAGISKVKQKVIRTVYNVLLDRYDSIELGTLSPSLGQAIRQDILTEVPTNSMMDAAIQYATEMIRGGLGGYVVMTPGENGYPQEILIMDTPDVNTAVNVWRFNQGGLGHSHSGYDGPFDDIALTQDGKINATMITTGEMSANRIRAGLLEDETGDNYWDLNGGNFVTGRGKVGPLTIEETRLHYKAGTTQLDIDARLTQRGRTQFSGTGPYYIAGVELSSGTMSFLLADDGDYSSINRKVFIALGKTTRNDYTTYPIVFKDVDSDEQTAIVGRDYVRFLCNDFAMGTPGSSGVATNAYVYGDFYVYGTNHAKSKVVDTKNYSDRCLYCYETPTPLFGDIGEGVIDEDGYAYVDIDDIFTEAIAEQVEYQVFLQKEDEGDCWIADKTPRYFVVKGTPDLKFAWELKAKQLSCEMKRFEPMDYGLEEYAKFNDDNLMENYIKEQEGLLYG